MNEEGILGLVGVVAWSETRWSGFDEKGFQNKQKYGFEFVKKTGYAHEWWNFYNAFDENYYIGHIEVGGKAPKKFKKGPIIFISRNVYNGKWYFVGFYGEGEYNPERSETGVKLSELIPSDALEKLREMLNEVKNEDFRNYIDKVLRGAIYQGTLRGKRVNSAVFIPECYVEITPKDIGVEGIGHMTFTYMDENKKSKIRDLLLRAKEKHEQFLKEQDLPEGRKQEINEILNKIEVVLGMYFPEKYESLKEALVKLKEEYGEYWRENSEKVLQVYREFVEQVINGEDPRKVWSEIEKVHGQILNEFRDIYKLFCFAFEVKGAQAIDDENIEKFREFLKKMREAETEEEAWSIFEEYKNSIKGLKTVAISTWAVIHPDKFVPLWWRRDDGVINIRNVSILGLDNLLSSGTIPLDKFYEIYPQLVREIKDASNEAGIQNLVEAAFYLSKYVGRKRPQVFLIQVTGKPAEHVVVEFDDRTYADEVIKYHYYRHEGKIERKDRDFEKVQVGDYILLYCGKDVKDCPGMIKYIYEVVSKEYIPENELDHAIKSGKITLEEAKELNNLPRILRLHLLHTLEGLEREKIKELVKEGKLSSAMGGCGEPGLNIRRVEYSDYKTILELDGGVLSNREDQTILDENMKMKINELLKSKKQLILYGPPGTGKTWLARNYIKAKTNDNREFYDFVTFHPSYSYEEFVEGLKPIPAGNGVNFVVEDGIFKRMAIKAMCEILKNQNDYPKLSKIAENLLKSLKEIEKGITATKNDVLGECSKLKKELWTNLISLDEKELKSLFKGSDQVREFYLAIDEINRGDISKIFGELITLLEADKRLGEENQFFVILPYSKEPFAVPPNLYIIGTMNTADRSIALIDVALRRRFGFIEVMPSYSVLLKELLDKEVESEKQAIDEIKRWVPNNLDEHDPWDIERLAIRVLYSINERIKKLYDKDHQIGHSYLLKLKEGKDVDSAIRTLRFIWYHEILPLLQEYFYDSPERLKEIIKDFVEVSDNYFEFKDFEKASDFWEELRKVAENK